MEDVRKGNAGTSPSGAYSAKLRAGRASPEINSGRGANVASFSQVANLSAPRVFDDIPTLVTAGFVTDDM
jgi:hypothetical protein